MRYVRLPFRDFESYFKVVVGLDEDDVQLISKQYNSQYITNEIFPGNYSIKNISEALSRGFKNGFVIGGPTQPNVKYDKSDSIVIEFDKFTMTIKLIVRYDIIATRSGRKSFFGTILFLFPHCDYKK